MSNIHQRSIVDLVTEYEAQAESKEIGFFGEEDFERLVDYYEAEDDVDQALEVLKHALVQHPSAVDLYLKKASLLLDCARFLDAIEVLETASLYAPRMEGLVLLRAEALLFLGRSEEALVILDELREVAEGEILADIFFLEGLHYEQQEQHERMYFALAASLRENPSHTDALEHYWKAVEHCRKHEEAIDLIEELLEARPYSSTAWFYLGNAHAYEGRYAEAIDCYEYAYLSDENFEHALRECAELCYTTQAYNRALGHFQELMERFEVDGEVLLRIGQCHQSLGRYRMARTFLHQALQYDPLNDEIFFHIGICHAREEDWQQAARYFRKAIHIEGEQDEYHLALAEAYRATGKITQAKRHYELAAELSPETANYWVRFAFFLIEARRGAEALKVLDQADEHVFSPELAYCRVACLFLIGRRQEACYWLSEALSEEFDAHNLLFEFVPELEGDTDVIALISIYTC